MSNMLSAAQTAEFNEKGFTYARGLFAPDEIDLLTRAMQEDPAVRSSILDRRDGEGRSTRIALWNRAGDSVYGLAARCRRMVDTSAALLGGPVYHYQSKLTAKEPEVGGAWEWHQDYGYWYQNGCLFPDMASCLIALDRAGKENGCLQVLRGSHHMGRIEHGQFGGQTGADPERTAEAMKRLELVYCEMEPGTGLFFHSNLLHRSAPNTSPNSRWSLICCYNAASNDPYKDSHHPRYTPLQKVPDTAIKAVGARTSSETQQFLDPADDKTTKGTREAARPG
jgi:ectoine hydroxylase-related dioxygenase (phytanoyl-CoA dioxygenase family)